MQKNLDILNTLYKLLIATIILLFPTRLWAEVHFQVVDSLTMKGVPFVALKLEKSRQGTLTDDKGYAEMQIPKIEGDTIEMTVSVLGYKTRYVRFSRYASSIMIPISSVGVKLTEVTVKKKKNKYSKRNNPAVMFVEKIRAGADKIDPRKTHNNYSYDRYERISLGLNRFHYEEDTTKKKISKFAFLKDHIDTCELSGQPVLIVSVKEKASQIVYRREPKSEKIIVHGIKRQGVDDILDEESVQTFLEDVLREVDLYQNDITILQNRFVSPLSRIAPDFYKFFLTDTVDIGDEKCVELSFTPHNTATFGFTGHVYVPMNDTTMFIKRVDMRIPPRINLNFIENLSILQDYERAADGSRLKIRDDMTIELSILPGSQGLYARRNTAYDNHSFVEYPNPDIFSQIGNEIVDETAYDKDEDFWHQAAITPSSKGEDRIGEMVKKLRSVPLYYWSEKAIKLLFTGYVQTGKNSKIDVGPLNTFISYNDLEGYRFRFGGMTTANLSPHVFTRGYVAYGERDEKMKYSGELEYSFNKKRYHSREFPIHSLKVSHTYDIHRIGQDYMFTNADNFVLSFKRQDDLLIAYRRKSKLEYTLELRNNLSICADITHERMEATDNVPFKTSANNSYNHFNETTFTIQLRYAPGEKFYQTKSYRIPVNLDAPVFVLSHTYGPQNFAGNNFAINKTELSFQKRFWFSAFGYTDVIIKGGHVWEQAPYPSLLIPNANLTYTIQPESFALMNPMEFVNDSYVSWDLTYWANGAIFNYIPYFKKLKLREVFCFRGVSGTLSEKNNPLLHDNLYLFPAIRQPEEMNWKPYMEASVGIENIFKCLRLDYVWRLSYKDMPGIDKSGLRIAVHVTF